MEKRRFQNILLANKIKIDNGHYHWREKISVKTRLKDLPCCLLLEMWDLVLLLLPEELVL